MVSLTEAVNNYGDQMTSSGSKSHETHPLIQALHIIRNEVHTHDIRVDSHSADRDNPGTKSDGSLPPPQHPLLDPIMSHFNSHSIFTAFKIHFKIFLKPTHVSPSGNFLTPDILQPKFCFSFQKLTIKHCLFINVKRKNLPFSPH